MKERPIAPYSFVFFGGHFADYNFQTDNGIRYQVRFKDTSYLFENYISDKVHAFEIAIQVVHNPTSQKPPLDLRISHTIAAIILDFIQSNHEQIIVYICDSSDDKQALRFRKFNQWFELFKGSEFIKIDAPIIDYNFVIYYTSIILHTRNPKRQEITEAFYQLIDDQQKSN